tara:strand:+ start:853 stop:1014 length:162 start_codon:yes stop_codon:yes gene_type:complete
MDLKRYLVCPILLDGFFKLAKVLRISQVSFGVHFSAYVIDDQCCYTECPATSC